MVKRNLQYMGKAKAIMSGGLSFADRIFVFALTFLSMVLASKMSFAQSLGDVISNTVNSMGGLPQIFSAIAYIGGVSFIIWALFEMRRSMDAPQQQSFKKPMILMLSGALMLSLPTVVNAAYNTLAWGLTGTTYTNDAPSGGGAGGLDQVLIALMSDIRGPMMDLIAAFCYIAGVALVLRGIFKLSKTANEGWYNQAGGMGGVLGSFLVGAGLLSSGEMMGSLSGSMFGSTDVVNYAVLSLSDSTNGLFTDRANQAIQAVIIFVQLVGWLSFLRGWFILKSVADGSGQASLQAGFTHIIGGAVAVNLVPFVDAVQSTLGFQVFTI